MLTEEQVNQVLNAWDFLEFSNSYRSSYYNRGLLTPDAVNAQMKNITMNPMEATLDGIEKALANPKSSEDILMSYSESLENQNMYYKRMLRYLPDMACFNLVFDPINAYTDEDMNSKEMKEDLQKQIEDDNSEVVNVENSEENTHIQENLEHDIQENPVQEINNNEENIKEDTADAISENDE